MFLLYIKYQIKKHQLLLRFCGFRNRSDGSTKYSKIRKVSKKYKITSTHGNYGYTTNLMHAVLQQYVDTLFTFPYQLSIDNPNVPSVELLALFRDFWETNYLYTIIFIYCINPYY